MTSSRYYLIVAIVIAGCGWGKPVCTVIDAAHEACAVIRYLGPDGKEHDVRVTRAELEGLAKEAAARQAQDGGAP